MSLTIREALSSVEPLRRSRVVAGAQGLDNVVRFVNVMEVPDILDWVHPGELLVTTMYPLRDKMAAVESLIPRLAEKGLAGLAVNPLAFLNEFPQCMLDAADALAFPLIELPPNVSFIDIIQPLTSKILALQANELLQSRNIHRQFIDLVLGGGSYGEIAQGIAQLVKRPVSIVDRFRRILGNGFYIGQVPVQRRLIQDDVTGDSYLSDLYRPEIKDELPGSEARRAIVYAPEGPIEHVVYPVKVGASILGQIVIWGALDEVELAIDLIAIEHGATVAALKMMEKQSITEVEHRFQNEILEGLLSDLPASQERAVYLAHELGCRLLPPFVIIMVSPDLPAGITRSLQLEPTAINSSLHLASRYIRSVGLDSVFWYQGPKLVVFFPLRDERGSKAFLLKELTAICQRIEAENMPHTVSIGISNPAFDLSDFRQAYDAARDSLEVGRVLQKRQSGAVTHHEDLGIFRVIAPSASPASLERFCQDTIGLLVAYDRENGTDLIETLRVFLANNQNCAQTAKALYVHYNTLRYRLDRIKEVLGDALDNPRQRLAVEVALQLYPFVASRSE